uniref:DUF4371 domain-containing protein n=1 Tax=Sinocyclocheilus grahami TaxID=75366 RepID=A0A672MSI7_SINGR
IAKSCKRQIDYENRFFQSRWKTKYIFTEFKGAPMCLVCLETKSSCSHLRFKSEKNAISEGEIVKQCTIEMAKAFGYEKTAKNFESASLSHRTVACRISDIQCQIQEKPKHTINNCRYFSLTLDESTDATDVSQLLIFARVITENFDIQEKLLNLASLHSTTKEEDIFKAVKNPVREYGGFAKLPAVVTDGAPVTQGTISGLAGLLKKSDDNCPVLHCIIYQEALCAKTLDFGHVMNVMMKVTNLIRGGNRVLNHRKFAVFLDEVSAAYGDLLILFGLHNDILLFLEDNVKSDTSTYCCKQRDPEYLCDMAFLTDMTMHLNNLNTQLQEWAQMVSDIYVQMNAFQHKFNLFHNGCSSVPVNLTHFPVCKEMHEDAPECKFFFLSVSSLELCGLQSDPFFQARRNERGLKFWKLLPESCFPLRDFARLMHSMFGSTYICESSLSTMEHIKSKERNRLTDDTLFQLLQVGCTNFELDIESIVHQQERPQVSHWDVFLKV